jgi:hypothetical protein
MCGLVEGISDSHASSILRVQISCVQNIEAVYSSKMLVTSYQTTRWYKPEDGSVHLLSLEYLTFCMNKHVVDWVTLKMQAVIIVYVVSNYTVTI